MNMKKKTKIPLYTTEVEPEDYTPFSMVFASVWKAYDAGEINPEKLLLFLNLYRGVNPHNGYGFTSYAELCLRLKRRSTKLDENAMNKLMVSLRDDNHLVWFPQHSGSREFPYVLAKFKLAQINSKDKEKWIDIKQYFQSKNQSISRAYEPSLPSTPPEPPPRQPMSEQRLERSNGESITSIKEDLDRRYGRPPQTNTES